MQRPEEALQRQIINMLHVLAKPGVTFWHCPNGGGRSKAEAGILKAMGVRSGVHDLHFIGPDRFYGTLEVKAPRGKLSENQRAFGFEMERCGHQWEWADSIERAMEVLNAWGLIRSARL